MEQVQLIMQYFKSSVFAKRKNDIDIQLNILYNLVYLQDKVYFFALC
jgi:hypothetical protein